MAHEDGRRTRVLFALAQDDRRVERTSGTRRVFALALRADGYHPRSHLGRTAAPIRDPRYLGHQAREVLTHALVTVPIAWSG